MMTTKKLGILGGMGAAASAHWYSEIVKFLQRKYKLEQDYEFPEIYIFSLSMEGWSEKGIDDEDLVKKGLLVALNKMKLLKPDFIIIACNTAHYFYDYLQSHTDIKIISLIDTCVDHVKNSGYKKVGVLSSETTNSYGIYKSRFEKNDIECISVDLILEQPYIDNIILAVQGGTVSIKEVEVMERFISKLKQRGAEVVILGCTELPLVPINHSGITVMNSGIILFNEISELLYENVHCVNA